MLFTTSCANDSISRYNIYIQHSPGHLIRAGVILLKQDNLSFEKDNTVKLEDGDEYKIHNLLEIVKSVNQDEKFQMISRPPDDYVFEIYTGKNGVKRVSSKGGSWIRVVRIEDKDFIKWLKIHLLEFGINLIDE